MSGRRSLVLALAAVTTLAIPESVQAATYWDVDDSCGGYSAYFYAAGPSQNWHVHSGDGFNGCHMWTNTVCGSKSCSIINWSAWYLPVDTSYDGTYSVGVWRACDSHFTNDAVRYNRFAYGTAGGSTELYTVDQHVKACDITYYMTPIDIFQASSGGYMRMNDKSRDYPDPACADYLQYLPV